MIPGLVISLYRNKPGDNYDYRTDPQFRTSKSHLPTMVNLNNINGRIHAYIGETSALNDYIHVYQESTGAVRVDKMMPFGSRGERYASQTEFFASYYDLIEG